MMALRRVQTRLGFEFADTKRRAEDAERIRQALDVAATNMMVADAGYNIIYTNASLQAMLATAEPDIRKDLPQFSAASVVGTNIDSFHKQPSHQRGMLDRLKGTHKTRLHIGGRRFDLIVNPVVHQGKRLGTVVEWKDITAELAAQEREQALAAENARVKQALDTCSTNVMIAGADGHIVYMNHSVTQMMQRNEANLRTALPQFDARRLIGANFDTFHRNPAHQRNLLANLKGEYKTEIQVSGLTFSLVANPSSMPRANAWAPWSSGRTALPRWLPSTRSIRSWRAPCRGLCPAHRPGRQGRVLPHAGRSLQHLGGHGVRHDPRGDGRRRAAQLCG